MLQNADFHPDDMQIMARAIGDDKKVALLMTTLVDGNIDQPVLELLISAYMNCLTLVQIRLQLKEQQDS